jgi:hypothetical protein
VDMLVLRGQLTQSLGSALHRGGHALEDVPALLRRVLEERAWLEHTVVETGEIVPGFPSFEAYASAHQPEGLGANVPLIKRIVSNDPVALDLLNVVLDPVRGRHHDNIMMSEQGTSKSHALRRLRKDRPDLHARVLASEMSPHAAMVAAGFRTRMLSVPLDDMARLARTLRKHLTPDQVLALRDLLAE